MTPAVLVGASALAVTLLGRPGDAVTAGITTAVILVVAAVSPQDAWEQPILRLADTVVDAADLDRIVNPPAMAGHCKPPMSGRRIRS